ncbi:cupin domain protein, PF06172 family protein (macronuclear) [Tetrahymena thermophila SB210]|uniref:Cupin domain protein, PF06172 family protein n=1 Tax=Tetrahymena thermophila (strain SB210) TaxID=312017 RepID=Q24FF2_TETTS|nr:cupin domain protein, PF06172 family protein [Tetrahymena thermophila SB210]EAS06506.1 cupin domain protein, PF06172 family protein [Tetrahymena thermophila SB210]|eukprot:XP_001026751.1 cupin domain protein, PF06172 family protein [Tetrahymena thermophila SB210]
MQQSIQEDQSKPQYWADKLGLILHPEGGQFKELYRSQDLIEGQQRQSLSSIYFFLDHQSPISHFHEVDTNELFIFQHGAPMEIVKILEDGSLKIEVLGPEIDKGQQLVCKIHPCKYFASKTLGSYTLFSCVCCPAFQYEGFRMIPHKELIEKYPQYEKIINEYALKI